ncbi:MAG: MBL fold metallo-hydrolase, partial [Oscillospiraceae bacterium]|nr:MBL fold metallo-hydrolase [Oscillospiraceae bacterium]
MLIKIKESVYFTPCSAETDRPNLGSVRGEKTAIMVDSGNSPAHVQEYYEALQKEGLPLPQYVFLTHHHWDHTFGHASV